VTKGSARILAAQVKDLRERVDDIIARDVDPEVSQAGTPYVDGLLRASTMLEVAAEALDLAAS
jgi:hypothetical protein